MVRLSRVSTTWAINFAPESTNQFWTSSASDRRNTCPTPHTKNIHISL